MCQCDLLKYNYVCYYFRIKKVGGLGSVLGKIGNKPKMGTLVSIDKSADFGLTYFIHTSFIFI